MPPCEIDCELGETDKEKSVRVTTSVAFVVRVRDPLTALIVNG